MTVSLLVTTFTRLWGWNDRCSELHYGNWWDPGAWPGAKNQYVLASANLILTILFKSVCCETPKRNAESLECLFKKALNITFIKSCTSLHFALFHTFSTLFLTLDHICRPWTGLLLDADGTTEDYSFWCVGVCQTFSPKPRTFLCDELQDCCSVPLRIIVGACSRCLLPLAIPSGKPQLRGPCFLGVFVAILVSSWRHAQAE